MTLYVVLQQIPINYHSPHSHLTVIQECSQRFQNGEAKKFAMNQLFPHCFVHNAGVNSVLQAKAFYSLCACMVQSSLFYHSHQIIAIRSNNVTCQKCASYFMGQAHMYIIPQWQLHPVPQCQLHPQHLQLRLIFAACCYLHLVMHISSCPGYFITCNYIQRLYYVVVTIIHAGTSPVSVTGLSQGLHIYKVLPQGCDRGSFTALPFRFTIQ